MRDVPENRYVTVTLHGGRPQAVSAAAGFVAGMTAHGITCLIKGEHLAALGPVGNVETLVPDNIRLRELPEMFG